MSVHTEWFAGKILIVDDEPDIVEGLQAMLSKRGYEVSGVNTGQEALAQVEQDCPDLVLLDVMMPDMDGIEVCKRLRKFYRMKGVPILLLTALDAPGDKVKGLDAGADDFITKPVKDSEILARVRSFLRSRNLYTELEASYKKMSQLETLRDFLTDTIVHDLRSPLVSIQGSLIFLLEHLKKKSRTLSDEEVKKYLKNASDSCELQMSLIEDILDVSRMKEQKFSLNKRKINIPTLVDSCLNFLESRALRKNIVLEKSFSGPIPPLSADPTILQRIFLNLMFNSLKFTPAHGRILVGTKWLPSDRQVECSVEDSGVGIPKEDLENVFDKYFQADGSLTKRGGYGLGLTFSRLAVEAHNGRIWAESEEGKGSRFIFRLPLS